MKRASKRAEHSKTKELATDLPDEYYRELEELKASYAWESGRKAVMDAPSLAYDSLELESWLRLQCIRELRQSKGFYDLLRKYDRRARSPFFAIPIDRLINRVMPKFLSHFQCRAEEIANALWLQVLMEANAKLLALLLEGIVDGKSLKQFLPEAKTLEQGLVGFYRAGQEFMGDKYFVKDRRGGSEPKADLGKLRFYYQELLPVWWEASSICRAALISTSPARRGGWREEVKRAFPEIEFPDDLLERLPPKQNWPVQIRAIAKEIGGDSDPESLALLAAARCCGARSKDYKVSTLKKQPGISKTTQEFQKSSFEIPRN